jgi:hypothetical protein
VEYQVAGFLEKNKDTLPKEAFSLFLSSHSSFVQELFSDQHASSSVGSGNGAPAKGPSGQRGVVGGPTSGRPAPSGGGNAAAAGAATTSVATQFKQQLSELMAKIHTTRPHYIRCLKPNDDLMADRFHRARITEQLRYGGVLEAVRVARSGYPVRLPHSEFFSRYRCLATMALKPVVVEETVGTGIMKRRSSKALSIPRQIGGDNNEVSRQWCQQVLDAIMMIQEQEDHLEMHKVLQRDSVQLGKTKVFLRKIAYEVLEFKRISRLASAAIKVQAFMRGASLRREYVVLRMATRVLQRMFRGLRARRLANHLRRDRASTLIQRRYRGHAARQRFLAFLHATLRLQCHYRGTRGRRVAQALLSERKALIVQTWLRKALAHRRYRRFLQAVVMLQCGVRRRRAMHELRQLRMEAKEIGNLQKNNEILKEEISALRELLAKKAEADRLEKERQLQEETVAAAAAALAEVQHWREKYEAEHNSRIAAEARVQELIKETQIMEANVQKERVRIGEAEEKAQALQSELEVTTRQLISLQLARRKLQQPLAAEQLGDSASSAPTQRPRVHSGHGQEHGLRKAPSSVISSHRILDAMSSPRSRTSRGLSSADGRLPGPVAAEAHGSEHQDSSEGEGLSDASVSLPSSGTVPAFFHFADDVAQEEGSMVSPHLSSSATSMVDSEPGSLPPAPTPPSQSGVHDGSEVTPAALSSRVSVLTSDAATLPSRSPGTSVSPHTELSTSTGDGMTQYLEVPAVVEVDASGERHRRVVMQPHHQFSDSDSDLDETVTVGDGEEDQQEFHIKRNTERKMESMKEFLDMMTSFKENVSKGIPVEVMDILTAKNFVSCKMKLVDVRGNDFARARLVWEHEKVRGGFMSLGLLPLRAPPKLPESFSLTELFNIVRGFRKVRTARDVEAGDAARLLTLIAIGTPSSPGARAVVLRFDKRKHRNIVLQGLRRLKVELLTEISSPLSPRSQQAVDGVSLEIKGYPIGSVIPQPVVIKLLQVERADLKKAYIEMFDLTEDVNQLEREWRECAREVDELRRHARAKDEELKKAKQEGHDRFKMARMIQDLTMENANLRDVQAQVQASVLAAVEAGHEAEVNKLQQDLEERVRQIHDKEKINVDLLQNKLKYQQENESLREEARELRAKIVTLEAHG